MEIKILLHLNRFNLFKFKIQEILFRFVTDLCFDR